VVISPRAEKPKRLSADARWQIQQELVTLSKKLHQLEEDESANLELIRSGANSNRQLLLVSAVSQSLDLADSLISSYLDTADDSFWLAAG